MRRKAAEPVVRRRPLNYLASLALANGQEYQAVLVDFGLWIIAAFTISLLVCGCIYTVGDIMRR
jgi:hypothetical protein